MDRQAEVNQFVSPPGEAYTIADLQRQYQGMSPRDLYALICRRRGCKPSSSVTKMLSSKVNGWEEVERIDLSTAYVGCRGCLAVVELCKVLSNVKELRLSDNFLDNTSIWGVCKMAQFHPSIRRIDVSNNTISWSAGMCLLELTTKNHQIEAVIISNTLIKEDLSDLIQVQTRRNIAFLNRGGNNQKAPNPKSNHPTSIRLRSLKRFFDEVAARDGADGRIAASYIIDGVREMWKLTGREEDLKQRTPQFFERLASRATGSTVNWETFMILVMGEDIVYNPQFVSRLRFIFNAFASDGSGYVEAKDIGDILMCLNGGTPASLEEIADKKRFFDLDDDMSIAWDEFLLMFYDLGAQKSAGLKASRTPLIVHFPTIA